jgi:hypothetical protein
MLSRYSNFYNLCTVFSFPRIKYQYIHDDIQRLFENVESYLLSESEASTFQPKKIIKRP